MTDSSEVRVLYPAQLRRRITEAYPGDLPIRMKPGWWRGESWAVGVGHNFEGVELYAGYKYLDHDSALGEDYGIAVIGSRIMFN